MSDEPETMTDAVGEIAFAVVEEAANVAEILVLVKRKDGTARSIDNGLTAEQAKALVMNFHSWLDFCSGREAQRKE